MHCNHSTQTLNESTFGEILVDQTQSGKERDWKGKKAPPTGGGGHNLQFFLNILIWRDSRVKLNE
ncbi:hypothetical protein CEH05_20595 (plasmid) [Halobacillus halophilus]|nr:hypothetical protein CEH05_20555 [Halobacillus halophilus]ASF41589.1 hypothetical protein CEH05_20595 [Halobacillus halophilus]